MTESPNPTTINSTAFRNACGEFATGVTIISTCHNGVEHGMTANAFMSISLDPPLIAVSVAHTAKLKGYIEEAGRFAVSILAEGTEDLAMHFAGKPNPAITDPLRWLGDLPVAKAASAVFVTDLEQSVLSGDHQIFVGRVTHMETRPDTAPILYHKGRFGKLHQAHPANADVS